MSEDLMLDVKDSIDLHVHPGPSLFQRPWDDVETAKIARNCGMAAILLKDHFENTASRAYHTARQVPDIKVFGGIVLNRYVGGLNPVVAETALGMGAKAIWMPTIDSARHVEACGSTASYAVKGDLRGPKAISKVIERLSTKEGLSILEGGKLRADVKEIVKLTCEYNAILCSGHLFKNEIFELVKFAKSVKHNKVVVTHATSKRFAGLTKEEIKELCDLGCFTELCATHIGPPIYSTTPEAVKQVIDFCGTDRFIISSDSGMASVPCGPEAIRVFSQCLYEKGTKLSDLKIMMIANPKKLLDL